MRAVLERLEREDADERERGLPASERSRQVARPTGQFLFALVAPQTDCEITESAARVVSTIWLAQAPASAATCSPSRRTRARSNLAARNIAEAGLEEWADLVEGDAHQTLPTIQDVFDVVFLDAEKEDYEALFAAARDKVEPGALFVADNVLSNPDPLARYSAARQADPTLESLTLPLDRGLELSVVLG